MGRIIFTSVLITGLLGLALWFAYASGRRTGGEERGILSRDGARLLDDAAKIMSRLGITTDIDDPEIIRSGTRDEVNAWLARYSRARNP